MEPPAVLAAASVVSKTDHHTSLTETQEDEKEEGLEEEEPGKVEAGDE